MSDPTFADVVVTLCDLPSSTQDILRALADIKLNETKFSPAAVLRRLGIERHLSKVEFESAEAWVQALDVLKIKWMVVYPDGEPELHSRFKEKLKAMNLPARLTDTVDRIGGWTRLLDKDKREWVRKAFMEEYTIWSELKNRELQKSLDGAALKRLTTSDE